MSFWLGLGLGLIVGCPVGMVILALCMMAKNYNDDALDALWLRKDERLP